MKILLLNLSDQKIPPPTSVIRADLYISIPLATELTKRGHQVDFLCPKESNLALPMITSDVPAFGEIIPLETFMQITDMQKRTNLLNAFYVDIFLKLLEIAKNNTYDIIHIHTNDPLFELAFTKKISTNCVFTLHSVGSLPEIEKMVLPYFNTKKNNYFVSISNFQRKTFPAINFTKTVYNGINTNEFKFNELGGENLIFAGRLRQSKGVKEAILISKKLKRKIIITGAPSSTDVDYFNEEIKPLITDNPLVNYITHTEREFISSFYKFGKVTVFPIQWDEPFGLVMIESMACGSPVVAFARGSVPEVIQDGVTGFIVNPSDDDIRGDWIIKKTGLEGMCEAIERIYSLSDEEYRKMRVNCNTHVEKNFSMKKMVDEYEALYKEILTSSVKS